MPAFPRRLRLVAALAAGLALATPLPAAACILPDNIEDLRAELLVHLNAERKAAGLKPLKISTKLQNAAQAHACDNADHRSISHDSSDGGTLKTRLRRAGYPYRTAAENTGRGFATPKRAVEWWMGSDKHRTNILLKKIKEVGIGIAWSDAPDNKLHWILDFGASR